MCGPIAISLPRSARPPLRESAERMMYHAGRVITYSTLGAVIGLGGNAISLAGYGRTLSIAAGVMMAVSAVTQLVWHRAVLPGTLVHRALAPVRAALQKLLTRHGALAHLGIGLLNGLLPCGLVTAALLGSLGTGSILKGALFMSCFGLGTVPLMAAVSLGGARLTCSMRHRLRYAAPVMALVVAMLFLFRGAALGIPYISPAAPTAAHPHACCAR
jgi:sulfite exporter TauE/SafE